MFDADNMPTPYEVTGVRVKPEWIDHNGHMNVAFYLLAFDESIGSLFEYFGLTDHYRHARQVTTFVGDFHIHYVRELMEGDPIRITHQLVDCDHKRMHLCQAMYHADEGYLAAQSELISLHVDARERRVAPMGEDLFARVDAVRQAHARLDTPTNRGRLIGMRRHS
ncbi:MAG: thioesterase family protein [Pseudomonadota bacterium]